jgi:hypothetical protein
VQTGKPLGDVLQSARLWNGEWFLVVNNSAKIEVLSGTDLKPVRTLSGFTSPRYLFPVSEDKAYVSDLYEPSIWVVRRNGSTQEGRIPMPGWTEEMELSAGLIWVVCRTKPILVVVDPQSDRVTDSLSLPGNLTSIAKCSGNRLWVSYEKSGSSLSGIALVQTDTRKVVKHWPVNSSAPPDRLATSLTGDTLYFLANGIRRLSTEADSAQKLGPETGNFYGLGYDPLRRQIWVSDAMDFVQKSRILQLDHQGTLLKEWEGGPVSSRFYFW